MAGPRLRSIRDRARADARSTPLNVFFSSNTCVLFCPSHFLLWYSCIQPVYRQLGLEFQKVKQPLGLQCVTISNFANKIVAYENIATSYIILHNHISVYYTDVILFSDFIRRTHISVPRWDSRQWRKWKRKKNLKNLSPEMANILSNFEGWGPTDVAYKRKKEVYIYIFPNYFSLRTEGVLPTPASQSLIYWFFPRGTI